MGTNKLLLIMNPDLTIERKGARLVDEEGSDQNEIGRYEELFHGT